MAETYTDEGSQLPPGDGLDPQPTLPHRVILASAGAGKTYQLSSRYLELLRGGARPESILATTFTRKAAGEILGRVLTRLADAATNPDRARTLGQAIDDPTLDLAAARSMLSAVTETMHRVGVSTLDSFFNRMAGACRFELGLPTNPRLVEDGGPISRQLRRQAIDAMLGDADLPTLLTLIRRLQHDHAKRSVTDALDDIVANLHSVYRQTDAAAWRVLTPIKTLEPPEVIDAIQALESAEAGVAAQKAWHNAWVKDLEQARAHDWQGLLKNGIAAKIAAGEEKYRTKKPLPPEVLDAYRPLIAHARAELVNRVAYQTHATHDLLTRYHAHDRRLRREQRILTFGDLPLLLADRVASAPGGAGIEPLYFRLDGRVQHLLLDEFQDTAPTQWAILEPFAVEITAGAGAGAHDEAGPDRSLLVVGDVKQAIYGWRGGCAEVFDRVMNDLHLPDSVRESLAVSFRSSQVVLDVVNTVFGGIADLPPLGKVQPHAERWQGGFEPHAAHFTDRPGYVELAASPTPVDEKDVADADDASGVDASSDDAAGWSADDPHLAFVADRIAQLHAQHPTRSIGVLVRRNKTASSILDYVRRLGLHASGEGGSALTNDPAVELVASALTLADHPGHTAAAFHVHHSALGSPLGLTSLDPSTVRDAATAIRRALLQDGYAATITAWARRLTPHLSPRSARRLEQLIDLAERFEPAASLRASDFVRWVESARVEDPAAAPIRVMTTHRAKGLQFDVVVLAELEPLIAEVRSNIWQYRPEPTAAPTAVYRSCDASIRELIAEHQQHMTHGRIDQAYDQELGRRVADDLSALYVAMTRPRYALHLIVSPLQYTSKGELSSKGVHNQCPASILRHALTDVDDPIDAGVLYAHGDPNWDDAEATDAGPPTASDEPLPAPVIRFSANPDQPRRSWSVRNPSRMEAGAVVRAADLLRIEPGGKSGGRSGRGYGAKIHESLAAIAYADRADESQLSDAVREMLRAPAVRSALSPRFENEELWRERPFAVRDSHGRLIRGAFDRVAIQRGADGRATAAHLTDFKTDRIEGATELEAKTQTYATQIESYREALARMLRLPEDRVTAELVMLRTGQSISV